MLRVLPFALVALALLAAVPAPAAACAGADCLRPVQVCQDAIPWMCFEIDPEHLFDATALDEIIRRLAGPCTCDPVD